MSKKIKVGSDFSGVGAFNQALMRLEVDFEEVFACDMDKYARQTFIHNYGEPKYYPMNVYDREIPKESIDIYMTSPPCQAFSSAGKRLGKDDKRGILFFNSHEFIRVNKPRFFIFENVKGLLSDDGGKTFQEWRNMLGGKSVNGVTVLFPYEESVPYHLYWQVLNAKHHGVPQNRERVFLIGIRDDADNRFQFPKDEFLYKRLKDVLEESVDEKYFLSEKMINGFLAHNKRHIEEKNQTGFNWKPKDETEIAACLRANAALAATDNTIQVKSGTSKGYDEAREGDSINFGFPTSDTRRGRVGKGVAQTLDTAFNQDVMKAAFRGRNPDNPSDRNKGINTQQKLQINYHGTSNAITTVQKDNVVIEAIIQRGRGNNKGGTHEISPTLTTNSFEHNNHLNDGFRIRRLTPRECFRLMDFPDTFNWPVSDSQAYKQAGNSIVVNVLYKILRQLPL